MDRLAFGTDNGQIYLLPALKLISYLFLSNDQPQENFGKSLSFSSHTTLTYSIQMCKHSLDIVKQSHV